MGGDKSTRSRRCGPLDTSELLFSYILTPRCHLTKRRKTRSAPAPSEQTIRPQWEAQESGILANGDHCRVWMSERCANELGSGARDDQLKAVATLKHVAQNGPNGLPEKRWKNQGQFSLGKKSGKQVTLYAVKSFQVRVYCGYHPHIRGLLLCLGADPAKKRR